LQRIKALLKGFEEKKPKPQATKTKDTLKKDSL
jgi:hypothetical protein